MSTWYYTQNGQQRGPVSDEAFRSLVSQRLVNPDDLIWSEGMAEWQQARTLQGIQWPATPPPTPQPLVAAPPGVPLAARPQAVSPSSPGEAAKSRTAYVLLAIFVGEFGIHNFYAGYIGRGVAQVLISLFGFWLFFPFIITGVWAIIEACTVKADARGVRFA